MIGIITAPITSISVDSKVAAKNNQNNMIPIIIPDG